MELFRFAHHPLVKLHLTQPFGVDYTDVGLYAKLGLKGHAGLDFSAVVGTPVYATNAD